MQQHATMHASTIIEFEIDQKSTFIPLLSFEDDVKHDHYSYCREKRRLCEDHVEDQNSLVFYKTSKTDFSHCCS